MEINVFVPLRSHNTICFGLLAYPGECQEHWRTYQRMPLKSKWMLKQLRVVEEGRNHPGDRENHILERSLWLFSGQIYE